MIYYNCAIFGCINDYIIWRSQMQLVNIATAVYVNMEFEKGMKRINYHFIVGIPNNTVMIAKEFYKFLGTWYYTVHFYTKYRSIYCNVTPLSLFHLPTTCTKNYIIFSCKYKASITIHLQPCQNVYFPIFLNQFDHRHLQ